MLVTSNDSKGDNTVFPSDENGRAHFQKMLEATAQRMTPKRINALIEALATE